MTGTLAASYAGLICDLDGVVYRGATAVPHAIKALQDSDRPVHYATNNASRTPEDVAAHLTELGLRTTGSDVTTSSQAGAWLMRQRLGAGDHQVLAVGGEGVARALVEAGFTVEQSAASPVSAVLQGYGPQVTASMLAEVAYAVQSGALWIATNTDRTLPTDRGVAPGNGSLIGAVRYAVGRDPDDVAGKPHAPLYRLCAERMDAPAENVLAVGDRLDTDIAGAVTLGMDSLLVLTGVSSLRDVVTAPASQRPTYVVPDLRWLSRSTDDTVIHAVRDRLASTWLRHDTDGLSETELADELAALARILDDGGSVA